MYMLKYTSISFIWNVHNETLILDLSSFIHCEPVLFFMRKFIDHGGYYGTVYTPENQYYRPPHLRAFEGCLFSQLAALPFEQLTLTDICNTALISRSTFYRYFEDKYDLLHYCLGSMLDELGLNEDVMYFTNRTSVRDFLLILLRLIGENRILYQKIYHANQDGDLMRIIRTGLIRIMNDKIQAAEQKGYRLKLPAPIFTSLMTDFYFNIVQCYLDQEEPCDPDSFVDNVCLFIERDFFAPPKF